MLRPCVLLLLLFLLMRMMLTLSDCVLAMMSRDVLWRILKSLQGHLIMKMLLIVLMLELFGGGSIIFVTVTLAALLVFILMLVRCDGVNVFLSGSNAVLVRLQIASRPVL